MPPVPPPIPSHYADPVWIGDGATGVVWRVRDVARDELLALKVVRPNLAVHARFRARFAREVSLAAAVMHPNLVAVRDHGRLEDGRPYVAMDYADQGSLADLLERGVSVAEAMPLLQQVLAALARLHAIGLVHQDLKPENILLVSTPDGGRRAWVTDLGVAGARTELALTKRGIAGTREWMAPEQLEGRPQELGPWTDLYAFGLVLNQILDGMPLPLRVDGGRLVRPRPRMPASVPAALATLVRQLVDLRPYQRFDRAADVARVLDHAGDGEVDGGAITQIRARALGGSSTTFPMPLLAEAREPVTIPRRVGPPSAEVPTWNREPPGPLPSAPLPEPPWARPGHHPRLVALRDPPNVGREAIRGQIWTAAQEVVSEGQARVVLLVGDAACGKFALARSVAQTLDEGGWMESFSLRYGSPEGADDGYRGAVLEILAPWNDTRVEAERRIGAWLARDQQTLEVAVSAEARALTRWCGYVLPEDPPANAALGLACLYRHLDARSWRGGAMLVLEDAHNSRQPGDGLAICRALLSRTVGERPVLAVATLDAGAIASSPKLEAEVASLKAMGAQIVDVPRLLGPDLHRFLHHGLLLQSELAQGLLDRCGGSPVFATLLVRDWGARGLLRWTDGGRLALNSSAPLDVLVPARLEALCGRRLDGALAALETPARCAETLAAVALGGGNPPAVVARELDLEALDGLFASGLVRQRGFRLVFEHPAVFAEALRRAEVQADRSDVHRKLADAWEKLGQNTGADVDLAHGEHRLRAGECARAVPPLLRASRSALLEGRPTIARTAAALALDAATTADLAMARVEARQRLAEALLELDLPEEAATLLSPDREALTMDRRSRARDAVLRSRAAIALGDSVLGSQLLAEAARAYEATRDWPGLVETAHGQAIIYRLQGDPERAAERFDRMQRLNKHVDTRLDLLAHAGRIESRLAAGRLRGLEADARRLRFAAQDTGDTRNIAQAHYTTGAVCLRLRRLDAAERHFRTALALAAVQGDDRLEVSCENALGEVFRYSGDSVGARQRYARAAVVAERNGWMLVAAVARINLALLALATEREPAVREVGRAAVLLDAHDAHWGWLFVGVLRALWCAEDGDFHGCSDWLDRAERCGLGRVSSPDLWQPLERLAHRAATQGWGELARRVDAAVGMGPAIASPVEGPGVEDAPTLSGGLGDGGG